MKRNFINISVLLFLWFCFSAQLWATPHYELPSPGKGKGEFIENSIAYRKIRNNNNEVSVIWTNCNNIIPSTVSHLDTTYSVVGIDRIRYHNCRLRPDSIFLPNSIRWIGAWAFSNSQNLKYVSIPDSITSIGLCALENTGISSVFIPHNLTDIGEKAFRGTNNLEFFQVDSLNPIYTTEDGVLYNKSKTTLIAYPAARKVALFQIPDGVTHIAENAFQSAQIDSLFIPNSVICIGGAAFFNSKLSHVVLPENIKEIKPITFSRCVNLRNIIIPNTVRTIERSAFEGCISLDTIQISDNVISIGFESFHYTAWYNSQEGQVLYLGKVLYEYNEKGFFEIGKGYKTKMLPKTRITVPEGVHSISHAAFRGCIGLVKITLPQSLEYIGEYVFEGCENLRSINVYWQDPSFLRDRIFVPKNCKLIVPKGTKEKYQQLEAWKNFKIVEKNEKRKICKHYLQQWKKQSKKYTNSFIIKPSLLPIKN